VPSTSHRFPKQFGPRIQPLPQPIPERRCV